MTRLQSKLDDWRVSLHFKRVEATLRDRDVSHLSEALQLARRQNLDCLHNYAVQSIFPRNHERLVYSPCFIDRDGRECAVAHLIMSSGQTKLAKRIAGTANYAYVPQMNFPELDDWTAQAGLSKEELSLIQPGYWLTLNDLLPLLFVAWTLGLMMGLMNIVQITRRKQGLLMPIVGVVVTIGLLLVGFDCFYWATIAYDLGTHPDGYPYDLPLRDVNPLILGLVVTVGLAILVGGVSVYRIFQFSGVKNKNTQRAVDELGKHSG